MSDALRLSPDVNVAPYEKFAKDLQRACESGTPQAIPGCIARSYGFANWPAFIQHLEALADADSPLSRFEAAADAIVNGDSAAVEKLLASDPDLARARSTREHRSTLLHYVSANGVEDFRQKTPANIIEIARLLLDAGAEVNAESEAYGGRSTTLGLTATSCHPENAGVQIPLMELLIGRGAVLEHPDGPGAVNACLANGRRQAAEFLANRGARLDLEGASGVGRLDIVKTFFAEDGALKHPEMQNQMKDGFFWACEYGRASVVEFLLQRGVEVAAKGRPHGQTGLHWAAYGGHAEIVKLLIDHGSSIDARDDHFDGTPLDWALHAWGNSSKPEPYYHAVAALIHTGARLDPKWRARVAEKVNADRRMLDALGDSH